MRCGQTSAIWSTVRAMCWLTPRWTGGLPEFRKKMLLQPINPAVVFLRRQFRILRFWACRIQGVGTAATSGWGHGNSKVTHRHSRFDGLCHHIQRVWCTAAMLSIS